MFYAQTFLGRKSPFSTVWCAAHLQQHRIKKSEYTSTDISSTVENILSSEVAIALRLSAHLLVGVVRIYSKKVDYLYQDLNLLSIRLNKAFSSSLNLNLPEDATHAPFYSVTFPETFDLDALDLEHGDYIQPGSKDNHLKSYKEITLTCDQIPTGRDPYITVTVNEDTLRASLLSYKDDSSGSRVTQMEEDPQPSAGDESNPPTNDENPITIETMRDTVHENYHMDHALLDDVIEPDKALEKQILSDNEALTPLKETFTSGVEVPIESPEKEIQENYNVNISFGHGSLDLAVQSSPPIVQPQPRRRNRWNNFDESTVLSNKCMKKMLEETSDLCRVRKNGPDSSLGIWFVNKRLKKDAIFKEPIFTGLSSELTNLYQISWGPHLVSSNDSHSEPGDETMGEDEIEHIRDYEGPGTNHMPEILLSTNGNIASPFTTTAKDDFTPATTNQGSGSEKLTIGSEVLFTPDMNTPSDMETPTTSFGDESGFDRTVLSDIPELINSVNELSFLEQYDNSTTESLRTPDSSRKDRWTPEFETLTTRTRLVAQNLEKQMSITPNVSGGESHGDLSLNKILQGKSRKISARMFYETLVLKSYGYIDVRQEEPYGDITLSNFTRKRA